MSPDTDFPKDLLAWAGHRAGGVRRLFDPSSGRPGDKVFTTSLLARLEAWTHAIANCDAGAPRIILLVGGPGNGKTEAVESTIGWLDIALGGGTVLSSLEAAFKPAAGDAAPRLARARSGAGGTRDIEVQIVQDASETSGEGGKSAATLLIEELEAATGAGAGVVYLCCVNRGVLDDALAEAIETRDVAARALLQSITQAVSLVANAPECWPLQGFPEVGVWPMDAESLLLAGDFGEAPIETLLDRALSPASWTSTCLAGPRCPFCQSQQALQDAGARQALVSTLRWYEIASGKRWSFRDLFSLCSYLLAGHRSSAEDSPCSWAAGREAADAKARVAGPPAKLLSTAIFDLVAAQYHQALFHGWDPDIGGSLLRDLTELQLKGNNTAMGLAWFLSMQGRSDLPATIEPSLVGLVEMLDPGLAAPEEQIPSGRGKGLALRDLDIRFSRRVRDGLDFVKSKRLLTPIELDLLERLSDLDDQLSRQEIRRRRPTHARRVQRTIRDFASRLARRSIGARFGLVRDATILAEFQKVVEAGPGDSDRQHDVAEQVRELLNHDNRFAISLTTTFGQPLPPTGRQVILEVGRRQVRPLLGGNANRPTSPLRYLEVGSGASKQSIALTFELFKAVTELERGMSPASLPRSVLALLDTTRARLSGPIVRDEDALADATIRLGATGKVLDRGRSGFSAKQWKRP